jgi:hypothetical protein
MPNVLGRPHMLPERWWEYEMALPKTCARSSGDSGAPGCRWGTATAVLVWEGHACCGWGYAATVRWCFQSAMHAIAARAGTKSLVTEAGAARPTWWSCSRSAVSPACCDADVVDRRWVHLRDPGAREGEPAMPPLPPTRSRPRRTSKHHIHQHMYLDESPFFRCNRLLELLLELKKTRTTSLK